MYKRILVPTDGSLITEKALASALALAKLAGAQLQVLAVKEREFIMASRSFSALTNGNRMPSPSTVAITARVAKVNRTSDSPGAVMNHGR